MTLLKKKLGGNSWQNINLKKEGTVCSLYKELLHTIVRCSPELVYNSLFWRRQLDKGRRDAGNFSPAKNKGLAARLPRRPLEGEEKIKTKQIPGQSELLKKYPVQSASQYTFKTNLDLTWQFCCYYTVFKELPPKFNAGSDHSYLGLFKSPNPETCICMENIFYLQN